ncbi:MAG: hypothetical protein SGARI_001639 [Bacillariaceae sp.]
MDTKSTTEENVTDKPEAKDTPDESATNKSSEEEAPVVELDEFIACWKSANESKNAEEIEKIYTTIVDIAAEHFTYAFMKDNEINVLFKASAAIFKSPKRKEAKQVLEAEFKKKKGIWSEANKAEKVAAKADAKKRKKSDSDTTDGKPAKKPRVSHDKILEVSSKMTAELAKNYEMGIKEMSLDTLTTQLGYKNKRSDAIFNSVKHLRDEGIVVKLKGDICQLTDKGVKDFVKEVEVPDNADALLAMYKKQFLTKLGSIKNGSGNKVQTAASSLWEMLQDGKTHEMEAVLKHTGYGMARSTGIAEIVKTLTKELEFAVKEKDTLRFTDKVYGPFGRP